jgi:hypothetical protein
MEKVNVNPSYKKIICMFLFLQILKSEVDGSIFIKLTRILNDWLIIIRINLFSATEEENLNQFLSSGDSIWLHLSE